MVQYTARLLPPLHLAYLSTWGGNKCWNCNMMASLHSCCIFMSPHSIFWSFIFLLHNLTFVKYCKTQAPELAWGEGADTSTPQQWANLFFTFFLFAYQRVLRVYFTQPLRIAWIAKPMCGPDVWTKKRTCNLALREQSLSYMFSH